MARRHIWPDSSYKAKKYIIVIFFSATFFFYTRVQFEMLSTIGSAPKLKLALGQQRYPQPNYIWVYELQHKKQIEANLWAPEDPAEQRSKSPDCTVCTSIIASVSNISLHPQISCSLQSLKTDHNFSTKSFADIFNLAITQANDTTVPFPYQESPFSWSRAIRKGSIHNWSSLFRSKRFWILTL